MFDHKSLADDSLKIAADTISALLKVFKTQVSQDKFTTNDAKILSKLLGTTFGKSAAPSPSPTDQIVQVLQKSGAEVSYDGEELEVLLPQSQNVGLDAPPSETVSRQDLSEESCSAVSNNLRKDIQTRNARIIEAVKDLVPQTHRNLVKCDDGNDRTRKLYAIITLVIGFGVSAGLIVTGLHFGAIWEGLKAAGLSVPPNIVAGAVIPYPYIGLS